MRRLRSPLVALLAWIVAASALGQSASPEIPQFVLLCFDTTPGPRQPFQNSDLYAYYRAVNHRRPSDLPPNGYTLFLISGGLQFDPAHRRLREHELPFRGILPRNRPVVHYASDLGRMTRKAENIRSLAAAGVEMGSHAVRHDHGREWDLERWEHEIADNERIVDLHGLPRPTGFRAPFLEWNEHLYTALAAHGYRYDVSRGGRGEWPERHERTGLWLFTMPSVDVPGRAGGVLYFDDNMLTVLSAEARARGLSGAAAEGFVNDEYVAASLRAFERRYRGNRAPLVTGGHGTLRTATLRFMREVCPRPGVRCATFGEAVTYLETHPELAGTPAVRGQRAGSRGTRAPPSAL